MAKIETPKIGELRSRIELQSATVSENAQFRKTYTWTTFDTVWGKIEPNQGLMFQYGDETGTKITHVIITRYRTDINRNTQLKSDGRSFRIHRINPLYEGRKQFLILSVEEMDTVT